MGRALSESGLSQKEDWTMDGMWKNRAKIDDPVPYDGCHKEKLILLYT